jgi:hypothetical protein
MSYIGASDLVYNNKDGIHSGGFNVQSIMMKGGISPIMTINNNMQTGGSLEKVSDIFGGLVIPAFAYHNNYQSGGSKHNNHKKYESDDEDDVINDDLHDKLLDLMNNYDNKIKQTKKKSTRKNSINKKNITKKMKISK